MAGYVEELDAPESEQILERVAAIDVAKASAKVCLRVPAKKRRVSKIWDVGSTTRAITELADALWEAKVQRVVLEATSDYWRPYFYLLEARGLTVWLVDARQAKQVPGRPKTDKLDAVWLAKLNERGMLRPCFVPPVEIRVLRDYTRLRRDLVQERTRHKQRVEKLLEDALIKLSVVASDIFGKSGRAILDAMIAGQRDPQVLAEMALGRLRKKHDPLVEALTGRFDAHHAELTRMLVDQVDTLDKQIDKLDTRISALIEQIPAAQPPPPPPSSDQETPTMLSAVERLDEITGVGITTAQTIIAELGLDMNQFPTAGHAVSWAKLCPRTIQSGPRHRGGRTGQGNPYLKGVLGEAAAAASRTNTFLGERHRRLARRRGKARALVATARSILVIAHHLLADPTTRFHDLGADYHDHHIDQQRRTRQLVHQLQALGHQVTLAPAAA